ncbi:hypothetical protein [Komagataeibacter sp. FXV3]|nr:hypothetical protein [Komagataeibacter sp. FXV3]
MDDTAVLWLLRHGAPQARQQGVPRATTPRWGMVGATLRQISRCTSSS